jgi:hypothetical protein
MNVSPQAYRLLQEIHREPCGERTVCARDPEARELLRGHFIEPVAKLPSERRSESDRRYPQVQLTSAGVHLLTRPVVVTYTTAPESYDGFGTRTVDAVVGRLKGGTEVRRVETPSEHVNWQRQRYHSGAIFLVANEQEWKEHIEYGLATSD